MSEKLCASIGCINVDPHYHTGKGIEYSRMELIEVLVERDNLKTEIARLKAERDRMADDFVKNELDRVTWKAKAEKLAEALRKIAHWHEGDKESGMGWSDMKPWGQCAKEALAAYEQGKGDGE